MGQDLCEASGKNRESCAKCLNIIYCNFVMFSWNFSIYWNTRGSCLWKTPGEMVRYFGLCNLLSVQVAKQIYENSDLWGMFVSCTLCLLAPLFLDKCPQIKEIYPPLQFFEYTCLYISIRYRTLDLMYCQNSYMQRSLLSYAEVRTKSV